jgi:hypothetical protein
MKCPECGQYDLKKCHATQVIWDRCGYCGYRQNERTLIDPAELLALVEKAISHNNTQNRLTVNEWAATDRALVSFMAALKGDPSALKKLAGVE